jgi:hypothetical protein
MNARGIDKSVVDAQDAIVGKDAVVLDEGPSKVLVVRIRAVYM